MIFQANECLHSCPEGLYCPRGQEEALPNGSPRVAMIRNRTHKLVYRATGVSELYNFESDPYEVENLYYEESAARLQMDMRSHLLDWYVQTSDATPSRMDSRGTPHYPFPIAAGDPWATPLQINDIKDPSQQNDFDYVAINGVLQI